MECPCMTGALYARGAELCLFPVVDVQAEGRRMAIDRSVEHFIHNRDGEIGERNTYPRSRDLRASRG